MMFEFRCEEDVVLSRVVVQVRNECGKPSEEVEGSDDDMICSVVERVIGSGSDSTTRGDRELFGLDRRSGDVVAEDFVGVSQVESAARDGTEGQSRGSGSGREHASACCAGRCTRTGHSACQDDRRRRGSEDRRRAPNRVERSARCPELGRSFVVADRLPDPRLSSDVLAGTAKLLARSRSHGVSMRRARLFAGPTRKVQA